MLFQWVAPVNLCLLMNSYTAERSTNVRTWFICLLKNVLNTEMSAGIKTVTSTATVKSATPVLLSEARTESAIVTEQELILYPKLWFFSPPVINRWWLYLLPFNTVWWCRLARAERVYCLCKH